MLTVQKDEAGHRFIVCHGERYYLSMQGYYVACETCGCTYNGAGQNINLNYTSEADEYRNEGD